MENSSISKKIAKLFSLAEGNSNINEAEAAMKKAEALLVEHNLSMSDIKTKNIKFGFIEINSQKFNIEVSCITSILRKHFFVETLNMYNYDGNSIRLFGESENIKSAEYVFNFLGGVFESLWCTERYSLKVKYGKYPKTKVYNSFIMGLYVGLNDKLTFQREETLEKHFNGDKEKVNNALITINNSVAINKFMNSEISGITTKKSIAKYDYASDAFSRGVVKGGSINISKAIT